MAEEGQGKGAREAPHLGITYRKNFPERLGRIEKDVASQFIVSHPPSTGRSLSFNLKIEKFNT
jgi:hypothetical protein